MSRLLCSVKLTIPVASHSLNERRFLEWAVERSSHDVGFAGDLEFTPTGNIDDQHRLREHLRSKQSLKLHATNWHAMMRSGMM